VSLHRRQFLLTRDRCEPLADWAQTELDDYVLYTHPDLDVNVSDGCALVGFALDPERPHLSNAHIVAAIARLSVDQIGEALTSLAGRYVVIRVAGSQALIWHDACGLRSVYYTRHHGHLLAASQPSLFDYVVGPLGEGPRGDQYRQSAYAQTAGHWMPRGLSLYEDVHHLVPNHYLIGSTGEQVRYWPTRPLERRRLRDVVEEGVSLLPSIIAAGVRRMPLSLGLTAGWDSRTVLAAARQIAPMLRLDTLRFPGMGECVPDLVVPPQLCASLGLAHHIIDCRPEAIGSVPDAFARELAARTTLEPQTAYGVSLAHQDQHVCMSGNGSEVARCFYYRNGVHAPIRSVHDLMRFVPAVRGWRDVPSFHAPLAKWYAGAAQAAEPCGIDILDLFYWEHRLGSWLAHGQGQWDALNESFTPFNHRGLLEALLSVDPRHRSAPDYRLHRRLIRALWPELLAFPLNQRVSWRQRLKNRARVLTRAPGLYQIYRRLAYGRPPGFE
jgi:hypothetical protein